ncbi:hypothetical protein MN608_00425 [Microdochium nivale]|nr:hypothetical protein MN608_00425 [Microdochium nivale]
MKATATSVFALLAASGAAAVASGPEHAARAVLAARQTTAPVPTPTPTAVATGCAATAASIWSSVPMPSDDLIEYFMSAYGNPGTTTTFSSCDITNPPSSAATFYSSYTSSLASWSSAQYAAALSFALSGPCKDSGDPAASIQQIITAVDLYMGKGCSAASTTSSSPAPTNTQSSSAAGGANVPSTPTGTVSSSTTQPAAGAHVTHAPLMALAAGVVAAAVLL